MKASLQRQISPIVLRTPLVATTRPPAHRFRGVSCLKSTLQFTTYSLGRQARSVFEPKALSEEQGSTLGLRCGRNSARLDTSKTLYHHTAPSTASDSTLLKSDIGFLAWGLVAIALLCAVSAFSDLKTSSTARDSPEQSCEISAMTPPVAAGRPGNLTAEQEEKLRKLWELVFQACGQTSGQPANDEAIKENPVGDEEGHKKKRFGMFRKKQSDKSGPSTSKDATAAGNENDKYGMSKTFQETLANQSPESIRETIWSMVKCDHPDALLLRFLRARKWDVEKAFVMMISTMSWRKNEMHVDDKIMKNGEAAAVQQELDGDSHDKKMGHDFMQQIRMGKSFLHGTDKEGRPICVVRVRLHKQGDQCEESLEEYTVYIIETARMVLKQPVDTATIVFDMTSFSMANMDYGPLKFMIKCFEANYPESLGTVLVHRAPWVFQGIWKIIRGWLDPVVAAKVHFTNDRHDLEQFIEPSKILKELGGDEDWEYQYTEPVAGENEKMQDEATKTKLLAERQRVVDAFEAATLKWIADAAGSDGKALKAEREELAAQLKAGYWTLDPYLRARSVYDRQGDIKQDGSVDWYSSQQQKQSTAENGQKVNNARVETSADDVD